jgi:hypothetical protein
MWALKDITVAFVCMNLPFRMFGNAGNEGKGHDAVVLAGSNPARAQGSARLPAAATGAIPPTSRTHIACMYN